jgi:hypothetical protein
MTSVAEEHANYGHYMSLYSESSRDSCRLTTVPLGSTARPSLWTSVANLVTLLSSRRRIGFQGFQKVLEALDPRRLKVNRWVAVNATRCRKRGAGGWGGLGAMVKTWVNDQSLGIVINPFIGNDIFVHPFFVDSHG